MHPELARLLSSAVPFDQWEAEKFPAPPPVPPDPFPELRKGEDGRYIVRIYGPGSGVDPLVFGRTVGKVLASKGLFLENGKLWTDDKGEGRQQMTPSRFAYWSLQHICFVKAVLDGEEQATFCPDRSMWLTAFKMEFQSR